jgi:type II secretory pathway component PulF
MGNRVFEEAVAKAAASVERGGKLSEAMAQTGVFPTTATWLLGAAEEKGDLVACLAELGDCYHQAAERRGLLLAQLIEPFTIIVLGLCVGFVVISFFMPLFGLGSLTSQ